nr:MAG TPA: hypothetical protein [Bacteriophage sp.]
MYSFCTAVFFTFKIKFNTKLNLREKVVFLLFF